MGIGRIRPHFPVPPAILSGGEAKKLALTACMRKLLIILNAMLTNETPWVVIASQPA
jgi:hypothetical protein